MALKLRTPEVQPITLALAKKFRDMEPLRNERPLQKNRAKYHAARLMRSQFFTAHWGRCYYNGTWYRGNGNHTSNLICACFQAHNGGLDEKSLDFYNDYLSGRGGEWSGAIVDLPEVKEGDFDVLVETFEASSQSDLVEFFKRYDSPQSVRTRKDVANIYIAEHSDLYLLNKSSVKFALTGVLAAARRNPAAFRLPVDFNFGKWSGMDSGAALKQPEIKQLVRWIVENVADIDLYKQKPGATLIAETYLAFGEETTMRILEILDDQIEQEKEPGIAYYEKLRRRRGKVSADNLLTIGKKVVQSIVKSAKLTERQEDTSLCHA